MGLFSRFFQGESTRETAKRRLQLVLIHDRSDLSVETMEALRKDLIVVINRYLEIDEQHIELDLEREDSSVVLVANIPVRTVKRQPVNSGSGA
jgi:cell division topological specificity factor